MNDSLNLMKFGGVLRTYKWTMKSFFTFCITIKLYEGPKWHLCKCFNLKNSTLRWPVNFVLTLLVNNIFRLSQPINCDIPPEKLVKGPFHMCSIFSDVGLSPWYNQMHLNPLPPTPNLLSPQPETFTFTVLLSNVLNSAWIQKKSLSTIAVDSSKFSSVRRRSTLKTSSQRNLIRIMNCVKQKLHCRSEVFGHFRSCLFAFQSLIILH